MAIKTKILDQIVTVGDQVKVTHQFKTGDKIQKQAFEGKLIAIKGRGVNKSFTVRKIAADAVGVEKIWPVESPGLTKIKITKKSDVRRSKLYYLRGRKGKLALKTKTSKKITKTDKEKKNKS